VIGEFIANIGGIRSMTDDRIYREKILPNERLVTTHGDGTPGDAARWIEI
jgi:hypothetical protein